MTLVASPTTGPIPLPTSVPDPSKASCLQEESTLCRRVADWTGQDWLGAFVDWFLARPVTILFILVVAVFARLVLHRLVDRLAERAAEGTVPGVLAKGRGGQFFEASPLLSERRAQRAQTMASVLKSLSTGIITAVAFVMILSELGIDIAPLIASAGIVGVALGFGAQTLVKDFLSGIFMILEDQYGVGDVVDVGEASGSVEAVGLRVTRLRDVEGTVWYVRNGEIIRVGNKSQGWARAVLDVPVAYGEDVARVRELLLEVAAGLREDEDFRDLVLEDPEVWGVEALTTEAVVVRVVVKTQPLKQWDVARELRQRIMAAFEEHEIEIPFLARTVWIRGEGPGAGGARRADAEPADALAGAGEAPTGSGGSSAAAPQPGTPPTR